MRRIAARARDALAAWGLEGAPLRAVHHLHNTTFRIGQRYALPDFQSDAALQSEVVFLEYLAGRGVPGPRPVRTSRGRAFALTGGRRFLLFRWIHGRRVRAALTPRHARAQGELIARLHESSLAFTPPAGFERRRLTADTLSGEASGFPRELVRARLKPDVLTLIDAATQLVRQTFDELSERALVHGDITPGNTVWLRGRPQLIDFDGLAWAPLAYDLAVVRHSYSYLNGARREALWRVFLDGYASTRELPAGLDAHLDGLVLGRRVISALWLAGNLDHPSFGEAPTLLAHEVTEIRRTIK